MEYKNINGQIKKNNFSQNQNWLSLILQKILISVSDKKISSSTIKIVDEIRKLNSEYQLDLIKYIQSNQENNDDKFTTIKSNNLENEEQTPFCKETYYEKSKIIRNNIQNESENKFDNETIE